MELALLVYAATEYLARKVMKEKKLKLTGAEHRVNVRPTGEFLLRYVSYLGIALQLYQGSGNCAFFLTVQPLPHKALRAIFNWEV